jgi:hypothetical protein
VNWLNIFSKLGALSPDTRAKVLQLISLIAELSGDPEIKALLDSLKTA